MVTFWILAAGMILVASIVVARVFIKETKAGDENSNILSLAIYEKRLVELDRDRKSGVLTEVQAGAERLELERTLLEEINSNISDSDGNAEPAAEVRKDWPAAAIIVLFIPVASILFYYQLGSPELINGGTAPSQSIGEHGDLKIEDMVARLAQKMEQNPDDPQGWRMLTRSYMAMGRYSDAARAAERLYKLTGDDPDVLLEYADALAMANNSTMAGKPEELVQKALTLDPDNVTGLWLAGMARSERGDLKSAINYWQQALPKITNEADKTSLNNLINSARKQLGEDIVEVPVSAPSSAPAAASTGGARINVKVSLNPDFNGKVSQDTTLFITAQETAGPPMPIAVVRRQVGDLPLEIILDDSKAMIPTRKLSNFEKVKIGARISRSGNAIPQSGDLTAEPVVVDTGEQETVSLVINREVK